jgi:hypothetical protein
MLNGEAMMSPESLITQSDARRIVMQSRVSREWVAPV